MRLIKSTVHRVTGPLHTYATWNPTDKGSGIVLSNGNLTVTSTSNNRSVRATVVKSTGKWYWEVRKDTAGQSRVGIGNGGFDLSANLGDDTLSLGYDLLTGTVYYGGSVLNVTGTTATVGDVISMALDTSAPSVTFYKNGTSFYSISYSGLLGASVYPSMSVTDASGLSTANFGASAFTYPVPVGHNSGIYL